VPSSLRVALATCRELPELDEDYPPLRTALASRGIEAVPKVWDDPADTWPSSELTVIRATWDYATRREAFLAWAAAVPWLANPLDVVTWNTDKTYLQDLEAAGLPVVPTRWLSPGDEPILAASGEYVVKPVVGAGAKDTARYGPGDEPAAIEHVRRLLAEQRRVMVQPYLSGVDEVGETALIYVGGAYSHAVRKGPLLHGPDAHVPGLFREEQMEPRTPSAAERELADRVLAAVPGGAARLLYARVDLLPGPDGTPVLLELELTEPSLFLVHAPGAADRFADAIVAVVGGS